MVVATQGFWTREQNKTKQDSISYNCTQNPINACVDQESRWQYETKQWEILVLLLIVIVIVDIVAAAE